MQADQAQNATVRLYRNEQFLGEQKVELSAGKNLFTFPQTLSEPGFYSYDVAVDAPGDPLPQNNRATGFATVRGEPRLLIVSADPEQDKQLAAALQSSRLEVSLVGLNGFPGTVVPVSLATGGVSSVFGTRGVMIMAEDVSAELLQEEFC